MFRKRAFILSVLVAVIAFFLIPYPQGSSQEVITISTYYPSPMGVYQDLTATNLFVTTGMHIGAQVDANLLSPGTAGASSTQMFIGNATINVTASDRRMKKNITPSALNVFELIKKIEVVDFDWKEGEWAKRGRATGLIAQDVYEYLPQVVGKPDNPENMWSVEYHHMVPYLIKAIQTQQKEIDRLKEEIGELKAKFSAGQ